LCGEPRSGNDGGNEDGKGITDTPGDLKLQAEGHNVRHTFYGRET